MNDLILLESVSARNSAIIGLTDDRATEYLNKAKALVMAVWQGVGAATTEQMAEYYEVSVSAVESAIRRNKDELTSDGLKVVKGKDLKDVVVILTEGQTRIPSLTIWTPRAALRLGMLLQDSEVAKQVRTVLLDTAMQAPQEKEEISLTSLALSENFEDALVVILATVREKKKLAAENQKLLEDKQQLQLQAAKDAPKIDDYNRLLNTDGWMCVREIHKCIGLPKLKQKDLNLFLRSPEVKILSKDTNQPYATWVAKGWAKMQPDRSPSGYPYNIPVFSWTGCIKILEALKKHGRIPVDHQCEFDFGFKVDRGQLAISGSKN